jgi:carboxyl-terminal processing protease
MNRNRKRCWLFACALICQLLSCGNENQNVPDSGSDTIAGQISYNVSDCSVSGQNEFVYRLMKDTYLWYNHVPDTDLSLFDSPEALLSDIRYSDLDRWSYISDMDEYYAYYEEGKYIGLGFSLLYDSESGARIMFVYNDSPAHNSGLARGDRLVEINGMTIEEVEAEDTWDTVFGEDIEGVQVTLLIEKPDESRQELLLVKETVEINTVLHHDVLEIGNKKIGYIVFTRFLMTSLEELTPVFTRFKNEGVDELILDLRYNGGGRVVVAKYLADLIAGENADDMIFQKYIHNDKYRDWDDVITFSRYPVSLNLSRLIVIATNKTASASEMLVNGLKPFLDVVVVGGATTGKPVGMYGHDFCDKHISPIEFKVANANDESDYFSGINPACVSDDDFERQLGDIEEDALKEALYYIAMDECSEGSRFAEAKKQFSERKEKRLKAVIRHGLKGEIGAF